VGSLNENLEDGSVILLFVDVLDKLSISQSTNSNKLW